jgi:hypothetical protein
MAKYFGDSEKNLYLCALLRQTFAGSQTYTRSRALHEAGLAQEAKTCALLRQTYSRQQQLKTKQYNVS